MELVDLSITRNVSEYIVSFDIATDLQIVNLIEFISYFTVINFRPVPASRVITSGSSTGYSNFKRNSVVYG